MGLNTKRLGSKIRGGMYASDLKKNSLQTDEERAAWNTLYGDMDYEGRKSRATDLSYLYQQENSKYNEGYALLGDKDTRDQYRDAWKVLYGGYDNPYWTGNWGGQKSNVDSLVSRADNWTNEVSQYAAQQAAAQQAAATTAATTAVTNPVTTALKTTTVAAPTSGSAKGTRSTYGGSLS